MTFIRHNPPMLTTPKKTYTFGEILVKPGVYGTEYNKGDSFKFVTLMNGRGGFTTLYADLYSKLVEPIEEDAWRSSLFTKLNETFVPNFISK